VIGRAFVNLTSTIIWPTFPQGGPFRYRFSWMTTYESRRV
jgi:hypothetical protein